MKSTKGSCQAGIRQQADLARERERHLTTARVEQICNTVGSEK